MNLAYDTMSNRTLDPRDANQDFCFFDDPEETPKDEEPQPEPLSPQAAKAVREVLTRLLWALTGSNHPLARYIAASAVPTLFLSHRDCEIALDTLSAVVGRTPEDSLAAVGRKYGLVRATISKRGRLLRADPIISKIQSFAHGGSQTASDDARYRALKYHNSKKEILCKPITQTAQKHASLLLTEL